MPSAEQNIRDLAEEWMIESHRQKIDDFADAMNDLHGDSEPPDEVEMLLINMGRTDYADGAELTKLHAQYLVEKRRKTQS